MQMNTETSGNSFQPGASKVMFEQQLEPFFIEKAPFQIPVHIKEAIVKYVPWVNLVLLILLFPVILGVLGLGTLLIPAGFLGGVSGGFVYTFTIVLSIIALVLRILALPGLFGRKRSGWVFTYYGNLANVLLNIVSFSIFGLLFDALFLFILFQVRSYYK
jgi:hypothetical protein